MEFRLSSLATSVAAFSLSCFAAAQVSQVNLVSDGSISAAWTDTHLINPWGLDFSPSGPLWVANNATGLSTIYGNDGSIASLVVTTPSNPSGMVFNGTSDFVVAKGSVSGPAAFIYVSEDGTISGWNFSVDSANAVKVVDNVIPGSVYKGCTIGSLNGQNYLYAANFHEGKVDVFDTHFKFVTSFTDPTLPAGYTPFNVKTIGSHVVVTFALADAARHDDVPGAGHGYVDEFTMDGKHFHRFASKGALNSPWGLEIAPSSWGKLRGKVLVGNFGDGWINAFDEHGVSTAVTTKSGSPLVIQGLWALKERDLTVGGKTQQAIFFTSGPSGETHGLLGLISP